MAIPYRVALMSDHTSGVRIVNTFHVVSTGDTLGEDSNAADVRDALVTALKTKYKAILAPTITLQSLVVREELAPGSLDVPDEASETIGEVGTLTVSGDMTPLPLCVLATLYTNAAVRSGHGRLFLPGFVPASFLASSGQWDTSIAWWTSNLKNFLDELVTDHHAGGTPGGSTVHPVVYSRTRRAAALPNYWFDVVSYTRRTQPHWLRSRTTAP